MVKILFLSVIQTLFFHQSEKGIKSINKIIPTVSLCYFGKNALAAAVTFNGKNYFFDYGVLSRQSKKPVTQYSLFRIASLTKLFTATMAAYLDQAKKINLNPPVSHYLTQLKNPEFNIINTHFRAFFIHTPCHEAISVNYLSQ
ncbi:serine hydrolase [Coxiella endosymbiont of Ornithodoros maritimus]|uniref:serine hydrolase n=1 Tax=Coxiella endosymbiont of Ornithodoros maritimus TaxID=1656172 RepID=UPI002264EC22|nr:serine hydrolase [Coxiella endosymbiont of Ornithodoros maritimus]